MNPDTAVFSALRPAMATIPIAKLVCISTGYAQVGVPYDMHKKYHGQDDDEVLVWQADTATMNPTISQTFIDKEIEKDPETGHTKSHDKPAQRKTPITKNRNVKKTLRTSRWLM